MSYVGREPWILSRVESKRVLHLGIIGGTDGDAAYRLAQFQESFHSQLTETAAEIVGVDISENLIEQLREQGVTGIYVGDVESLSEGPVQTESNFDVVVIGDLIEHLSNPGSMLDQLPGFLRPEGEIIVTTPNAFSLPAYYRFLVGRYREGKQHSLSFNLFTLENLLDRHGWRITEMHTCYQARSAQQTKRLLFLIGQKFFQRFPRFGGTLLVTATRRGPE